MNKTYDAVVIGAGPAGLGAASALKDTGISNVLIVEREDAPGGILLQCIHSGFGMHYFGEELTGPEYAERYIEFCRMKEVQMLFSSCVIDIIPGETHKTVVVLSEKLGLCEIETKVVILAMGCRERTRGNIYIPGSRPAGIMTAGLAQKMVNILGYLPGKEVVILGSGDIGLIMARRLTWEGVQVKAVIEIQPFPGGLLRNVVQCLNDFNIPLYLSHTITNIYGNMRVNGVEVSPVDTQFNPKLSKSFKIDCDTLLLSVGLIPENELSIKAGVEIDPVTRGAVVDSHLMTNIPGIFACGNVLHVHDLADWVTKEAEYCGMQAAKYIQGRLDSEVMVPVEAGNLVRYVLPSKIIPGEKMFLSLRPLAPTEDVYLFVDTGKEVLYKKHYRRILPSEMIRIPVNFNSGQVEKIRVYFKQEKS